MLNNYHLLYYWKDFYKNINDGKVGWLGASKLSKVFRSFNDSLSPSYDSWIIAFRWEKANGKSYPLAILKAVSVPVIKIVPDKNYEAFIYFDPWQSFKLPQPTDSSGLKKYHGLGQEIVNLYPQSSRNANFNGANGVQLISDDVIAIILNDAKSFREGDLSNYVPQGAKLPSNKRGGIPPLTENFKEEDDDQNQDDGALLYTPLSDSSEETLKQFLKDEVENAVAQIDFEYANNPGDDVDAVVKRRIGQGPFRALLEHKFGSACCISGLNNSRLLIASHIVPWSKATPEQKTDSENGLLLSVTWDALFDKGMISFSDDGILLCSEKLDNETIRCLGISIDIRLGTNLLTEIRKENLAWHRKWFGFD